MTKSFAFYYDSEIKRFQLDIFEYNPSSKENVFIETVDIGDSRHVAVFNSKQYMAKYMMAIPMVREKKP